MVVLLLGLQVLLWIPFFSEEYKSNLYVKLCVNEKSRGEVWPTF